jgi:hypothetical protein
VLDYASITNGAGHPTSDGKEFDKFWWWVEKTVPKPKKVGQK